MEQEKSVLPIVAHETYPEPMELEVSYSNERVHFVIHIGTNSLFIVFLCRN